MLDEEVEKEEVETPEAEVEAPEVNEAAENLEEIKSSEESKTIEEEASNEHESGSGRDEEKTRALQEALFRDTGAYVLNSSVENYQEQMVNEKNNDLVRGN